MSTEKMTSNVETIEAEAEKILEEARSKANEILLKANEEASKILSSSLPVDEVKADLEKGIVTVKGKPHGQTLNLFDLRKRINSLRDYTVTRMDVTALGHVVKFPARYYDAREYTHSHDRYKLKIGDMSEAHLLLADNEELHDLMKLGYERIRLLGTVSGTSEGVAVLTMEDFQAVLEAMDRRIVAATEEAGQ